MPVISLTPVADTSTYTVFGPPPRNTAKMDNNAISLQVFLIKLYESMRNTSHKYRQQAFLAAHLPSQLRASASLYIQKGMRPEQSAKSTDVTCTSRLS